MDVQQAKALIDLGSKIIKDSLSYYVGHGDDIILRSYDIRTGKFVVDKDPVWDEDKQYSVETRSDEDIINDHLVSSLWKR